MSGILSVIIYNRNINPIYSAYNLWDFGFLQRSSIQKGCTIISKECAQKYTNTVINHKGYNVYIMSFGTEIKIVSVTDEEYPMLSTRTFISKVYEIYINNIGKNNIPEIEKLLITAQDPKNIDKISLIRSELDDTKLILKKNIDDLLERGDSLEELLVKAEDLEFHAKIFANETDKMNKCCLLF